jgi:hypothetical protein
MSILKWSILDRIQPAVIAQQQHIRAATLEVVALGIQQRDTISVN